MTSRRGLALLLLCLGLCGSATPGFSVVANKNKKRTSVRSAVRRVVRRTVPRRNTVTPPRIATAVLPGRTLALTQPVATAPGDAPFRKVALEAGISTAPPAEPTTIENVAALVPFYEQLYRLEHGLLTEPLHIIQYGDSHTASDDWANSVREQFQSRFGVGGAGYSLAGRPFLGYRRYEVRSGGSNNWYSDGLALRTGDGRYGRGGVSMTTHAAGEYVTLAADCQKVEIYYLQQPGGGRVQFSDNGVAVEQIATAGDLGPGVKQYQVTPGQHHFELRTLDNAPVRLFGWLTDEAKGIAYEALGINGAQASIILNWDEATLANNLSRHQPALILLEYGTNDASNLEFTPDSYRALMRKVITRIRTAAPQASILLIGPPDRFYRIAGRGWTEYPRMQMIVDAQREVARSMNCAFWDLRNRMGGGGVMPQYHQAGLVQADHVHFTHDGYVLLGRVLYQELMSQYPAFVAVRQEIMGKDEHERPAEDPSHR